MANAASRTWLSNQSILRKLILAFALPLATLIGVSLVVLYSVRMANDAQRWVEHTQRVLVEITSAAHSADRAGLSLGEYAISGRPKAADEYDASLAQFRQHIESADSLTSDAAEQQQLLQSAKSMVERWRTDVADPLVDALKELPEDGNRAYRAADLATTPIGSSRSMLNEIGRTLEQAIANEHGKREVREDRVARMNARLRTLVLVMLGLGVAAGIGSIALLSRSVGTPIRAMTDLMTRLAGGDHGIEVGDRERRDEIGAIARALQVFKETAIEASSRNWVKENLAEIGGRLQTDADPDAFARTFTSELAPRVKAGVAVFYRHDEDARRLHLAGSYGLQRRKHLSTQYAHGEGLVGQVALERKPILLEQVPDDYVRIHSGLGEAAPRNIIALPLLQQDRLLGVIELGTFTRIDETERRFLDELMPIAALTLDNLMRAQKTLELLETTRAQSRELQASEEELRVQQEELAATNEELQAKATELEEQQRQLRASEEELRVQAEELQASNEELRQKTDTLNEQKTMLEVLQKETEEKARELARASQYKSDFLANMSHELRTPLNSLLILSRNLADNAEGNLQPDQIESARVIHESGTNLLRLINDILDLAKIEAGKMQAVTEDVELAELTGALERRFRHVAAEKALEFSVTVDDALPRHLHTDGARLEQILNNLVGNAFKFTRVGSVRVNASPADADQARLFGLAPEAALAIQVDDTGIGIPPDKIEHIFGTFEQMDASTARMYGGSGLGLPIARRLAELLGGGITVSSAVNEGSRFTVVLPIRLESGEPVTDASEPATIPKPAPAHPAPPAAPASMPPAQGTAPAMWVPDDRDVLQDGDTVILAIEDDPVFARTLVDMIRRKGYRALAAGDGESGLYLAAKHRPTGILLDALLPGIDGWAVIDRLKRDLATRHIPVHFISATDEKARAQAAGAVGFLAKPAERDAVFAAVERLLHTSDGSRRKVLLVDDDPDSRVAIGTLIRARNVEIVEAASAEAALRYLDADTYDCIVLDLGLPGMSGSQFLEQLAARGPVPPVVIHSARELNREENSRLRQYTDSIVVKGTRSLERLMDEVSLFLHAVRKDPMPTIVRDIDTGLSGRVVLIVDDDMRNIFALSKVLREKGLSVVMAQDGHKALRQLEENPSIEIVLMDVMMPGMDGYETTREIRKRPAFAKLPIIAVTAKAMAGDRDNCLAAGANDYLSKPIEIDKLLSTMRTWLAA